MELQTASTLADKGEAGALRMHLIIASTRDSACSSSLLLEAMILGRRHRSAMGGRKGQRGDQGEACMSQ